MIEINVHEKTRFRLATDRSDLQFAAKELCRKMANPEPSRALLEFPIEPRSEKVDGFAHSDWA